MLLLVGGFAAGRLVVPQAPAEGSPEVSFERDMAAHHDQAVEMAVILRERGTDEQLRAIALDIILTQLAQSGQNEIDAMETMLRARGAPLPAPVEPMPAAAGIHKATSRFPTKARCT